ncbi:MAG: TIGR03545 family protein [Candidatus Kryptonium sp.]
MKYIRKSGVILIAILVAIFILLNTFLTDRWLESQLEKAGSNIVGAKVEIDNLDLSLLKMTLKWQRIQITHPEHTMKNMIETGPVEFKLSPSALLKKKFVIENMQVLNIRTFTDRKTDGRLPFRKKEEKKEPGFLEKQFESLLAELKSAPVVELFSNLKSIKPKDIIEEIQFGTPAKVDSIVKFFGGEIEKYKSDYALLQSDIDKLKEIERNLRNINPSAIKTVGDLKSTYDMVNGSIKQINEIKSRYEAKINEIRQLPDKVNKAKLEIQEQIKDDIQKVKDYAKLPDLQTLSLVKYLIGPRLFSYYLTYERYSDVAEKYIKKMEAIKPEKEKRPPRLKGQDIHFVKERALPSFWLKRCALSGETNAGFKIKGEITNISSQPKIVGRPTILAIEGIRPDEACLEIRATFDFASEPSRQELAFKLEKLPIDDFNFNHSIKYLPIKVEKSRGDISVSLSRQGGDMKSEFKFLLYNPHFVFSSFSPANVYEEKVSNIVKNTFSAVKVFDVNAFVGFEKGKLDVKLNSSLDRQLTAGFKDAIGREVDQLKREAEAMARLKFEEFRKEFESKVEYRVKELTSEVEKYSAIVSVVENLREQKLKELDQEIKKRGSKILENIFKK